MVHVRLYSLPIEVFFCHSLLVHVSAHSLLIEAFFRHSLISRIGVSRHAVHIYMFLDNRVYVYIRIHIQVISGMHIWVFSLSVHMRRPTHVYVHARTCFILSLFVSHVMPSCPADLQLQREGMCTYMYVCMCECIHKTCVCVHVFVCTRTCTYMICARILMYGNILMYCKFAAPAQRCMPSECMCQYMHMHYIRVYIRTCILRHTYMDVCLITYMSNLSVCSCERIIHLSEYFAQTHVERSNTQHSDQSSISI
jgi:hypothetical protein